MTTVVTVSQPTTSVTVTESVVSVAVTTSPVTVTAATSGPQGATGQGVPSGGASGYILAKNSATSYDTAWIPNFTETVQHQVKAAVAINKGQAVYVSSANGTNIIVSLASNSAEATSSKTLGLLDATVSTNGFANVITEGLLSGFDTSAGVAGDPVWLGTSGNLIFGLANKPAAPAHLVFIGIVTRSHAVVGEIFVRPQNGFELEELHNVAISSIADNQVLVYDAASSLWKNEATPVTAVFSKQDILSPYVGTARYYFDAARTIIQLRASVGTAPTGSSLVVTVYKNGTSIGSVTIPAGSYTATTTLSSAAVANDYLTVSIISVGSTVPGSDLTVTVTA